MLRRDRAASVLLLLILRAFGSEVLRRLELDGQEAECLDCLLGVDVVDADGEGAGAAVEGRELGLEGAAAGVGVGVVEVPEEGDSWAGEESWGEKVFDDGGDFAGGGGVGGGAEDDPG